MRRIGALLLILALLANLTDSVDFIGSAAFIWESGIESITAGEGNTVYASRDGALFDRSLKELIRCPGPPRRQDSRSALRRRGRRRCNCASRSA